MSNADNAMGIALGVLGSAILVSGAICVPIIINDKNQTEHSLERLNAKIEGDLDVNSFSAQNVIFDKTNENYFIKITGSSKEFSYLAAKYIVNERDFYDIKPSEKDFVKTENARNKFLDNLLYILYHSEFLGKEIENLAVINNGELVLNLSQTYVDKKTNSMNYDLTIAELHNNDLKLGTFVVSAPLDENLMENPKLIYTMPKGKVKVEKVDVKTYKDVLRVEMHDDCTVIV